ncbi:MAG: tetratricopeptide repeat protein [Deferribacteraceae bacterium]|jgi:Tfp pilus assembly protein PilF|nr:tetratricopeptide repeat protein [Deferribacteraceae bacterium]
MFKNITVCISLGLIIISAAGCGKKERVTLGDNMTAETSVTSVVQSREPAISEGNNAFLQGDFQGAVTYYEQGLKQNRSVAYYNIGVSYYMMQNIAEAEKYFRLAVEEDPSFDEAVMNLVATLAEQEKSVEAERFISRLVNKKKSARVYVDMANLSLKNGSSAKAVFYYEKAMNIDNESDVIRSNYANFLISIGELDAGEELLNSIADKNFNIRYNLAYIAWKQGRKISAYENAVLANNSPGDSEEGNNKLASLFAEMRYYFDEANTLRRLIMWSPKKEYRIRLVNSYANANELDRSEDEANLLLKDYPNDIDVIVTFYNMNIARSRIMDAGKFIRNEYNKNPADRLLYQVVRHICLYELNKEPAKRMITAPNDSHFLNLARAAYYITAKDYASANAALAKVPENIINDYYVYKCFLMFKDGKLNEAEQFAYKINESKPEYFWYHFALAWNLRKPDKILDLIKNYRDDFSIGIRIPARNYSINPITFAFDFHGTGADIASMLLYPFFIEPDEMEPFMAMGYSLLKDSNNYAAIEKLQQSIEYSNAVKSNNDGVKNLASFKYWEALTKFNEAEKILTQNPFVQYNIGLAHYRNGEFFRAAEYFQKTINMNRFFAPAYVGRGLCMLKSYNPVLANDMFNSAIMNSTEYLYNTADENYVLPMITQARYLSMLAMNHMADVIATAEEDTNKDSFTNLVAALAGYKMSGGEEYLDIVRNSNIYHSKELAYLLKLYSGTAKGAQEEVSQDRNTVMAAKYINALNNKTFSGNYLEPHMNDYSVLTELVNISMLLGRKADGLRYLQALSKMNVGYAPQYKVSLYYFMWIKDFINAEASYATMDRLKYSDQDVNYYMTLYFLLNYNQRRLANYVDDFVAAYPIDYRGRLLSAFQNMESGNLSIFFRSITALLSDEPFLFNNIPLEIGFENF